jgi:predicted DNA-binding transcriptional regulator AlpA
MPATTIDERPLRHHLDRRAETLVASTAGDPDELLTTRETSDWIGNSTQWLEIGRHRGYGPPYVRVSPRCIRYRRGDVLDWLRQRTHARTAEYARKVAGA